MARRHRSLFPAAVTAALAAIALTSGCSDGESDAATEASSTSAPTTAAPSTSAPSTTATSTTAPVSAPDDASQHFPDVLEVESARQDDGSWTFSVTLSSPYDSPDQYADAWRVVGPDGDEYGVRILTHDHANEQPFTRSQSGIEIPDDVAVVTVEGRDLINGWGGTALQHELER